MLERFALAVYHLQELMYSYRPQALTELIDRVVLIKCQGAVTNLSRQYEEGLEWGIVDFFNGLKHYFADEQPLYVRTIACSHYELFDKQYEHLLIKKLQEMSCEHMKQSFTLNDRFIFRNRSTSAISRIYTLCLLAIQISMVFPLYQHHVLLLFFLLIRCQLIVHQ